MHDRGFEHARECDQLLMHSGATGSGKNRGFLRVVQNSCQLRDFIAWNLRRNGENRNTAAMAVIEPIDQMQVTRTATASADRQTPCEMCFCSSSKRCRLFMPYVNPLNSFACANRIRDPVKRVAGNAVNSLNSCFRQYID